MINFSPQLLRDYAHQVEYQTLSWPEMDKHELTVYLRRDDLASTIYPGNKFYKLFYYLQDFHYQCQQKKLKPQKIPLVSFGGAFSNHIHALAALGHHYKLPTIGIIRGHRPKELSPTLKDAQSWGMHLLFLNKKEYKKNNISQIEPMLHELYEDHYLIPEGGDGKLGALGCQALGEAIANHFDGEYTVCCPLGTGTSFSGIVSGLPKDVQCLGVNVLKGHPNFAQQIAVRLDGVYRSWKIIEGYHHGGYAKVTSELLHFMKQLETANHLLLEPVYTGKMLWAIEQLARQHFWPKGSRIVAIHTGGVQGRRGFNLS